MSLISAIHLSSGRFLCDIHLDRWTVWFFFGSSPTWPTYLGCFNVLYSWPSKREESLSLFIALLQNHPFCLSLNTNWFSVCSSCAVVAPISHCLLLSRLCCLYQPGMLVRLLTRSFIVLFYKYNPMHRDTDRRNQLHIWQEQTKLPNRGLQPNLVNAWYGSFCLEKDQVQAFQSILN